MTDRFFYRVRNMPHEHLNGRVVELITPAESETGLYYLERIYITPEEYTKTRAEQDIDR